MQTKLNFYIKFIFIYFYIIKYIFLKNKLSRFSQFPPYKILSNLIPMT